jgi:hypothetical protein
MCFDLEHKRVTSTRPLPMMPAGRDRYHLTEVHGRLGFAVWDGSVTTEVWVLDKETWSRWYSLRPIMLHIRSLTEGLRDD